MHSKLLYAEKRSGQKQEESWRQNRIISDFKKSLVWITQTVISFHQYFVDKLRGMGFVPSRADQELWIRKSDE